MDDDATLFIFVGRWTYEKGIDLVADAALWLLRSHPAAQLIVVGPIGDEAGHYAAARLGTMAKVESMTTRA